jgi:hypothetical protein
VKAALVALSATLPVFAATRAKTPPSHTPPHAPIHFAPPLPMLPSVARVRVEVAHDRTVVVEDVSLPRGDWTSGSLDLYTAFGSPGTPIAVDARIFALPEGQAEPRADDAGEAVGVEPGVRHTASSQLLLGRPSMAGVVLHVGSDVLRRAYGGADVALLRIRSLLSPPSREDAGAQSVVVRLGVAGGLALTLGKVQVVSVEPKAGIQRAEATLCGPEADARPLTVSVIPRLPDAPWWAPATIAPAMATRHPTDDLCVRWWPGN